MALKSVCRKMLPWCEWGTESLVPARDLATQYLSVLSEERICKPVRSYQAGANTFSNPVDWVFLQVFAISGNLLRGPPTQDRTVFGPGVRLCLRFFKGRCERIERHFRPPKMHYFPWLLPR